MPGMNPTWAAELQFQLRQNNSCKRGSVSPGTKAPRYLAVPNGDSQFVLVRFASAADLQQ